MQWNDKLATNIELMDSQHKEIIRRINDVLLAGNGKHKPEQLKLALKLLGDYCATHFSQEENLQLRSKYPKYAEHKKLHTDFLKKVAEFQDSAETSQDMVQIAASIEKEVSYWLVYHINGVDKVVARYLIANNFLK